LQGRTRFGQQGLLAGKRWALWAVEIEPGTKDDYEERFRNGKHEMTGYIYTTRRSAQRAADRINADGYAPY
jgi:hypothetical protein